MVVLVVALAMAMGAVPTFFAPSVLPTADAVASQVTTGRVAALRPDLRDFDPGNIITDEVFFAPTSLSASQVQAFLKANLSACAAEPDGPACLRDYRMTTPDRAADAYCAKYKGATNERASAIIAKVAKSCGVSAKVLLVLLQKEQSLVTSTAPTPRQYRAATGFACPDTKACDAKYSGFFNQVYRAARQYNRYATSDTYGWIPVGKVNKIQYHPNKDCGTLDVKVKNVATAGLYYYTPYTPNAAALTAFDGSGDECSAYGNRNFWRIFTQWFGSTKIAVSGPIQTQWLATGGVDGTMGVQKGSEFCSTKVSTYCVQKFARGTIARSPKAGAFAMTGALNSAWRSNGSQLGALGWPSKAQKCYSDGSCLQVFSTGYASTSAKTGTRIVTGNLAKVWKKTKTRTGSLGLPRAAAKCNKAGTACTQKFQTGWATSHRTHGNWAVVGDVAKFWVKKKGTKGALGYPAADQSCKLVKTKSKTKKKANACVQRFAKGFISVHPVHGKRTVTGRFATKYASLKAEKGRLGYPIGNKKCTKSKKTCSQKFSNGTLVYRAKIGTFAVTGNMGKAWTKNVKKLGQPTADRVTRKVRVSAKSKKTVTEYSQTFAKGKIVVKGAGGKVKVKFNKR